MSKLGRFAMVVVMDSLLGLMYYLWQVEGMDQAGNVFMFMVWFVGVGGVLMFFAGKPKASDYRTRLLVHRWFCCAATLSFLAGTIWAGHIVAACFYTFGWIVMRSYEEKSKQLWEAAQ